MKSILFILFLSSCTISLTNVNSSGHASDQVDETQSPSTPINAELTIPAV